MGLAFCHKREFGLHVLGSGEPAMVIKLGNAVIRSALHRVPDSGAGEHWTNLLMHHRWFLESGQSFLSAQTTDAGLGVRGQFTEESSHQYRLTPVSSLSSITFLRDCL